MILADHDTRVCVDLEVTPVDDDFITLSELAAIAHVSPNTLRIRRHRGTGPKGYKLGRSVLFRRAEGIAWIESFAEEPTITKNTTRASPSTKTARKPAP